MRKQTYDDLCMHPGIETIQSILAYFRCHQIKTKVLGSDFRMVGPLSPDHALLGPLSLTANSTKLSEMAPLSGLDAVCLSRAQAKQLQWSQIRTSFSSSPPARLRARQAQYPTNFLSTEAGFMGLMSAETQSLVATTLDNYLLEMKVQMDGIEKIVGEELCKQFLTQTLDLRTLFRSERKRGSNDKPKNRTVAQALEIQSDEDEVF